MHLTPERYDLPEAITLSYGCSIGVDPDNAVEAAMGTAEEEVLNRWEDLEDLNDSDSC